MILYGRGVDSSLHKKAALGVLWRSIDRIFASLIHEDDVTDEEEEKEAPQINPRCALRKVTKDIKILKLGSLSKRFMYRVQYHVNDL